MKVGVLVFPAVEELDFVGPWEVFGMWSLLAGKPAPVLVAQSMQPVRCAKGLAVVPQHAFADCPPLDVLVVPGGQGTRLALAFIARNDSPAMAGKVQLAAEYYPEDRHYGGLAPHAQAPNYVQLLSEPPR